MMEATARQTILNNTVYKRKKRLLLSGHDSRKPLCQAVSAALPTGDSLRTAYLHCIKLGTNIDPCCGTGGFLVQAFIYLLEAAEEKGADALEKLKYNTLFGREKENLIYPITLANMVLHGIELPAIWHGNTLTGTAVFGGLFTGAPEKYDYVLTNPPFGGKESKEAQTDFAYKTGATQVLFLQHVIDNLKDGGRCGIVLDEGVLFRTNETAFVQTKRKLLEECNLYAIISLPGGVFTAAGAGVKTNILFFDKGKRTEKIWYYDLSDIKVGKTRPLTLDKFEEFFELLPKRSESERSWILDIDERKRIADEQSAPLWESAKGLSAKADTLKANMKKLNKQKPVDRVKLEELTTLLAETSAEAKKLSEQAQVIDDAVFDLKAVNPNRKVVVDTRTPADLVSEIEGLQAEIVAALAELKK